MAHVIETSTSRRPGPLLPFIAAAIVLAILVIGSASEPVSPHSGAAHQPADIQDWHGNVMRSSASTR